MGIKKNAEFMLISNSLMPAFRNDPKKAKSKNHVKVDKDEYTLNSAFFIPILILFTKKFLGS